jgi:uncharacterized protein YkwD
LLLALAWTPPLQADSRLSQAEQTFFQLVNSARENPLRMAQALGHDPKEVLSRLQGLRHILRVGLPPLKWNQRLARSAEAHTRDMLDRDFISRVSPDGRTVEDRLRAEGYDPVFAGERIGAMVFRNFAPAEQAARRIFASIFSEELSAEPSKPRIILSLRAQEVGLSLDGGRIQTPGGPKNAYIATCDYGASQEQESELALFSRINDIRNQAGSFLPDDSGAWGLSQSDPAFPVLAWSETLAHRARERSESILSGVGLPGHGQELPLNRPADEGPAKEDVRFVEMVVSAQEAEGQGLSRVVSDRIAQAVRDNGPRAVPGLFRERFEGLGIDIHRVDGLGADGTARTAYLVVAAFGPMPEGRRYVHGRVYVDANENGRFDFGEGRDGLVVNVPQAPGASSSVALTRLDGWFQLPARAGIYPLRVLSKEAEMLTEDFVVGYVRNIQRNVALPGSFQSQ